MRVTDKKWVVCAVAVALCLITAAAEAQQQGRRGNRGGGPGGFGRGMGRFNGAGARLMYLQNDKVQKELELVDDQKDQIKKLGDKSRENMREMFSGLQDLPQEERQEKMRELQPKMEESQKALGKQVDEVLMPNQRDRLKQITVQIQGTGALSDEEVAKELALSDDQEKQIQQVRQEAFEKMRENFRPGAGGGDNDRDARRERMQKAQKETDDKVLAVLTSEQRDKFEKMKGEKFEFDPSQLFGQGGFGGPGGGGRGQRRGGGNNNN